MSTDNSTNDEIDLREVFKAIGNFFSGIGRNIIYFIASIRKTAINHKILFLSMLGAGQIVALAYALAVRKDYYETSIVLRSRYINHQTLENSVDKLDLMCDEEERTVLAKALNIDANLAKKILAFEVEAFVSQDEEIERALLKEQLNNLLEDKKEAGARLAEKLEYQNASLYEVIIRVTEPEIIQYLDTAFVNYMKQNDYIKRRMTALRNSLLSRKAKLIEVSKKVDSIKTIVFDNFGKLYDYNKGSNNVILSEKAVVGPIDVVHEELRINDLILDIDRELFVEPDFVVVDGFTAFRKPANLGLPIVMIISAFVSILLSYLTVAFIKFNNYLDKVPV